MTSFKILEDLNTVHAEILRLVSALKQDEINAVPFDGSWTAAQVINHLFKSDYSILKALRGHTKLTGRQPDEYAGRIKSQLLNFNNKMHSPEFIKPATIVFNKRALLNSLASSGKQLSDAIQTLDLARTCHHSVLIDFTRLELIYFVIYHTQRHIHQVKNIKDALVCKAELV